MRILSVLCSQLAAQSCGPRETNTEPVLPSRSKRTETKTKPFQTAHRTQCSSRPLFAKGLLSAFGLMLAALGSAGSLAAQTPEITSRLDALESAAAEAQMAGDNAWMMVCCALVLMMTGPGLALFYGGLVRRKNVLSTMMHSFGLMALVTVIWGVVGYSLAFSEGSPFVGGLDYLFLNGVGMEPSGYAGTIPHLTFMVFQLMFAIITPALISGAFAERMKFSGMVLFTVLWLFIVYFPMAHMVWGAGGFLGAVDGTIKAFDFAGGTVVHITSGVSALVCAIYLGKRKDYPNESMRPHNLVLSTVGACLLWVGWFGFNAGSALNASGAAANAFVTTHFGAAAAALTWMLAEWRMDGKASILGAISGAVAGLVAITPASGFVTPMPAFIIGGIAGVVCYLMVAKAKKAFGYDDALDAFGVHGVGGTVGAVLTGVFATVEINDLRDGAPMGLIDGNAYQVVDQVLACLFAMALAVVGSWIILKICDAVTGLRVDEQDEVKGLDVAIHGEEGYNFEA